METVSYWLKPHDKDPDKRRKLLRKQLFAGLVTMLAEVVKYRPRLIAGVGQGGLLAAISTRPLVLEAACRARILTAAEMRDAREAWSGVVGLISCHPEVLPQRTLMEELTQAIPEFAFAQPRGQWRALVQFDKKRYLHRKFAESLSYQLGCSPVSESEVTKEGSEVQRLLALPLPVYMEDDVDG